jgi:DNA-binding transcriptional LysR family regulator
VFLRQGPQIVDNLSLAIQAAVDGVGLAYMSEEDKAAPHLANRSLVRVLQEWCQPFAGFFLYYPSRRQKPAALSALIAALRI